MLGTIMAANVFRVIIPAHWELIRAKEEGRRPDPAPGLEAKRRSVHNNYLTLPVVFAMLAGHFPLTYGHSRAWLVLVARDRGARARPARLQPLAHGRAGVVGRRRGGRRRGRAGRRAGAGRGRDGGRDGADRGEASAIVEQRCATCHSRRRGAGRAAPRDPAARLARADLVATMVRTRAMPPGNATG